MKKKKFNHKKAAFGSLVVVCGIILLGAFLAGEIYLIKTSTWLSAFTLLLAAGAFTYVVEGSDET